MGWLQAGSEGGTVNKWGTLGVLQCADIAGPASAGGAVCGGALPQAECGGAVGVEGVSTHAE